MSDATMRTYENYYAKYIEREHKLSQFYVSNTAFRFTNVTINEFKRNKYEI